VTETIIKGLRETLQALDGLVQRDRIELPTRGFLVHQKAKRKSCYF
jgi:hypothetical protein